MLNLLEVGCKIVQFFRVNGNEKLIVTQAITDCKQSYKLNFHLDEF